MRMLRRVAALALLLATPLTAQAACTTPAGIAGDQFYNSAYNVMQYCNGNSWINMGLSSGSEADPQVGTLTNAKWCTTDGTTIDCTSDAPAGSDNLGTLLPRRRWCSMPSRAALGRSAV